MDKKGTDRSQSIMETTVKQDRAIEVLVAGGTHDEAAVVAGVARVTVTRWANGHPGFQAALNKRRSELMAEQIDNIRRIDGLALGVVVTALENGDIDVAMQWSKARGLGQVDTTAIGPTDPNEVVEMTASKRATEVQLDLDEMVMNAAVGITPSDWSVDREAVRDTIKQEIAAEFEENA